MFNDLIPFPYLIWYSSRFHFLVRIVQPVTAVLNECNSLDSHLVLILVDFCEFSANRQSHRVHSDWNNGRVFVHRFGQSDEWYFDD